MLQPLSELSHALRSVVLREEQRQVREQPSFRLPPWLLPVYQKASSDLTKALEKSHALELNRASVEKQLPSNLVLKTPKVFNIGSGQIAEQLQQALRESLDQAQQRNHALLKKAMENAHKEALANVDRVFETFTQDMAALKQRPPFNTYDDFDTHITNAVDKLQKKRASTVERLKQADSIHAFQAEKRQQQQADDRVQINMDAESMAPEEIVRRVVQQELSKSNKRRPGDKNPRQKQQQRRDGSPRGRPRAQQSQPRRNSRSHSRRSPTPERRERSHSRPRQPDKTQRRTSTPTRAQQRRSLSRSNPRRSNSRGRRQSPARSPSSSPRARSKNGWRPPRRPFAARGAHRGGSRSTSR